MKIKKFTKLFLLVAIFIFAGTWISAQQVTVTIGTGTDVTATGWGGQQVSPFGTYYEDGQNQMLFTAAELIVAGIGAGDITEIAWNVDVANDVMNGFNIEMKHTTATSATAFETGFTNVYSANPYTPVVGWNTYTITPFAWDGASNLLVKVCFDNTAWGDNSSVYYTSGSYTTLNAWAYNDGTAGCTDAYEGTSERPNTQITGETFVGGLPPGIPTNPNPADGATGVALTGDLTWDWGSDSETYDLWYGPAGSMAEVVTGGTVSGASGSYTYTAVGSTGYEWQVIVHNSAKATTNGSVWGFTTPYAITPDLTCQTSSGSWGAGGSVVYEVTMVTSLTYNFSCCINDVCAGDCDGDADFTMFDTDGTTQLWYIDGASGCGWDATTFGSAYDSWTPPADGVYFLQVDDYYGNAANYTLAYIASAPPLSWTGAIDTDWATAGNWTTGVPTAADNVLIPAGLTNYPVINEAGDVCNNLQLDDGGQLTITIGGDLAVAGSLNAAGTFLMDGGVCAITGEFNTPSTGIVTITGGNLSMTGWYETGLFSWASGTITLSGGIINIAEHAAFFGGTGVMDGPFVMTVGGTLQIGQAMFGTVTGGTVNLTGTAGDGFFLSPTTTGVATVYNLNLFGGFYTFARDDEFADKVIVNDFNIKTGSFAVFSSTGGTGWPDNFTVGGNCTVEVGANVNAIVQTSMMVNGNLTLESDATGYASWIDIGNINIAKGILEVQSYRPGESWHFISSPVSGATAGIFTGLYLQNHTESTNVYTDIVNTSTPLNVTQGYALYGSGLAKYQGTGLNSLDQTANLTRAYDGVDRGWNLVGNPYPSTIDWNAAFGWTKTNVNNSTWIEANGNWAIWNGSTGTNGASRYIAPGQGFFVEVADGNTTGVLGMAVKIRTHESPIFIKDGIADLLKLQAEGNGLTDETVIWFNEDATEGYDGQYDAHKLWATDNYPQFYSLANEAMAINVLPPVAFVPMGFKAGVSGEYVISTVEDGGFSDVVLEDLLLNTQTNLLEDSYSFTYNKGDNEARFIVHFTPLDVPEGSSAELFNIYSYYNNIYVAVPENTKGNIFVYDMMGQEITNVPITDALNPISIEKSAYYVVKVLSNENVVTKKVFIK